MSERQRLHDQAGQALAAGTAGDDVARAFSDGVERLLQSAPLPAGVAVLAQGGLARRELVPFADVDVLVLVDDTGTSGNACAAFDDAVLTRPLYALWDAGVRVGHAVRRTSELELLFKSVADKDGHAATALLEARPVSGDLELAERALRYARRELFPAVRGALLAEKTREWRERRVRHGASPFLQEPDIKRGAGALRDLHSLIWIGLLHLGEGARPASGSAAHQGDLVAGLLASSFLHPREAAALTAGRRELLRVRAALHLATSTGDDRLHAAHAAKAAALLGVVDDGADGPSGGDMSAAERLLQSTVRAMGVVKRAVDDALARVDAPAPRAPNARRERRRDLLGDGFVDVDGELHLDTDAPARGIAACVDAARIAAERGLAISEALAARRAALVDAAAVGGAAAGAGSEGDDADAAAALGRLCAATTTAASMAPGPFTRLLEWGALPHVLADIARLAQRVRLDGVHALTTDAHLALCADLALALVSGAQPPPAPLQPSLARTTRRHLVVAGALFHDMGKGLPGIGAEGAQQSDHSEIGARIVEREGPRIGLAADDVDILKFLVAEHLLLSRASQRRDLSDPAVVEELASTVRTPERLDLLALLTWVDMCAVAPGVGTEWKARLLGQAVERTRALLLDPAGTVHRRVDDEVRDRARQMVAPLRNHAEHGHEVDAFIDGASVRFLASRGLDELRDDVIAFFRRQEMFASAFVEVTEAGVHELRIVARDRPGLLADIASAFASEGANVLDAALDVRSDGFALDCFVVDDGRGKPLHADVAARLPAAVSAAADGAAPARSWRRGASGSVAPRVRVLSSDSWGRTVVEVRAGDRLGLLADLASAFALHGWSVALARIHTEGPRVTDVFTVDRVDGAAPTPAQLTDLERALLAAI